MSDLTLLILRIGFLAILWIFIFIVIYSLRSDLFGPGIRKIQAVQQAAQQQQAAAAPAASAVGHGRTSQDAPTEINSVQRQSSRGATRATASRIVVTGGPKAGLELDVPATGLTIGRSSGSGLQITDDYTSNSHAKLALWHDEWMLQDLDSTNGTFLAGKRVTVPTPVPTGTPIRIGTTTFELRR